MEVKNKKTVLIWNQAETFLDQLVGIMPDCPHHLMLCSYNGEQLNAISSLYTSLDIETYTLQNEVRDFTQVIDKTNQLKDVTKLVIVVPEMTDTPFNCLSQSEIETFFANEVSRLLMAIRSFLPFMQARSQMKSEVKVHDLDMSDNTDMNNMADRNDKSEIVLVFPPKFSSSDLGLFVAQGLFALIKNIEKDEVANNQLTISMLHLDSDLLKLPEPVSNNLKQMKIWNKDDDRGYLEFVKLYILDIHALPSRISNQEYFDKLMGWGNKLIKH